MLPSKILSIVIGCIVPMQQRMRYERSWIGTQKLW